MLGTFVGLSVALSVVQSPTAVYRAQWLAEGSYGIMVHYLITPQGATPEEKTADYNRTIDGFDLEAFMKTFDESGADWLIFTIGQNTGYWNSANEVMDASVPGHTPRRDLVMEIGQRVKVNKKRFIVYLPVEMSWQQPDIQKVFGWNPEDQDTFQKRYQSFIRAYSMKLGKLHDGWWFDGWYDNIHNGKWDIKQWITAARAGNPDAITAFNDGAFCVGRTKPVSPEQDYHAGEVHLLYDAKIVRDFVPSEADISSASDGRMLIRGKDPILYLPESQYIDGVQWHALVPIDSTFNPSVPAKYCHYNDADLLKFIRACKQVHGAVTLNVPIDLKGHIPEETAAQLVRLGKEIGKLLDYNISHRGHGGHRGR